MLLALKSRYSILSTSLDLFQSPALCHQILIVINAFLNSLLKITDLLAILNNNDAQGAFVRPFR